MIPMKKFDPRRYINRKIKELRSTVKDKKAIVAVCGGIDNIAPKWPYMPVYWYGDKSRVNWMVRVIGNAMVSQ